MISLYEFLPEATSTPAPHPGSPTRGKIPEDLLPVTCSFLVAAMKELHPGRFCSAVVVAFDGVHSDRFVQVAAVMDDHGEMISGLLHLMAWRPDCAISLGSLLETAADLYLDAHLSPWDNHNPAHGMLWIELHHDVNGTLDVVPRCVASFGPADEDFPCFPA